VTTAAAIIIGDEILSGKVREVNLPVIVDLLHELGVELRRVVVISDAISDIEAEVRHCARTHDVVITSGGVGPTHDDRTMEGVARAFDVPLERHPEIERMIRTYWKDRLTEAALRMADAPRGSRLLYGSDGLLPLVACRNVYVLPGIPKLFAAKIKSLAKEMAGSPQVLQSLFLSADESSIAAVLWQVEREFEEVKIGSYPRLDAVDHRVWVTVEGPHQEQVEQAVARLLELLPEDQVVRVERR
jgi:molybdenum cofactor synthesis domain-containing protein